MSKQIQDNKELQADLAKREAEVKAEMEQKRQVRQLGKMSGMTQAILNVNCMPNCICKTLSDSDLNSSVSYTACVKQFFAVTYQMMVILLFLCHCLAWSAQHSQAWLVAAQA